MEYLTNKAFALMVSDRLSVLVAQFQQPPLLSRSAKWKQALSLPAPAFLVALLLAQVVPLARWCSASMWFPQAFHCFASLVLFLVVRSGMTTAPLEFGYNLGTKVTPLLKSIQTDGFDPSNTVTCRS